MTQFEHLRHKSPTETKEPVQLIVACAPLRSNVNLSRILRAASCCGVKRVIACGNPKVDSRIARDGADEIQLEVRRSLGPVLTQFRNEGYRLVGLEQTTNSQSLPDYQFDAKTVLVIGNERRGLEDSLLNQLDNIVEIPVYGMPHSFNVATATAIAIYEYCRQLVPSEDAID